MKHPKHPFFEIIPTDLDIDFLKISKPFIWLSTITIVGSLVLFFTKGLNYGIDFTGGAEIAVHVPETWDIGKVRESLEKGNVKDAVVVQIGEPQDHEFLIKLKGDESNINQVSAQVENSLKTGAEGASITILKSDVVGPQAGAQLRRAAIISLFYAIVGIMIYISLRFDFRFGPGIVRALLMDTVVVIGVWILLGKEFNLTIIAALLTIAGYSCNDTIVIYDRIREYTKQHPDWTLYKVINRATSLNLGRTIITTSCTLFVVIALWIFGGPVLADFAFAIFLGFAVSVYSTIFLATPLLLYFENKRQAMRAAKA